MAVDYSKLSDEELEAIANDDYSKLSEKTLNLLAQEQPANAMPGGETPGIAYAAPQAATIGREVAALAPEATQAAGNVARQGMSFVANRPIMQTIADVAGVASHGVPWGSIANQALNPNRMSLGEAVSTVKNVATQGAKALGTGGRALGGALVQGAIAPESLFALPYQMAAYEQEKIRQNPNAPGLERNPYAMVVRGEAPTQGAAGAMNQRRAVVGMPIQGVTDEERRILEEDQKRRLDLLTRYEAAKRILGPR